MSNSPGHTEFEDDPNVDTAAETLAETEDRGDFIEGDEEIDVTGGDPAAGEGEEAKPPEDDDSGQDNRVPKSRFNEINDQRKAYREEAERLKAELEAIKSGQVKPAKEEEPPPKAETAFDFATKQRELAEAMIDGDVESVARLNQEIAEANRALAIKEAGELVRKQAAKDQEAKAQQDAQALNLQAANEAIAKYPFLDTDKEAMAEVVEWRDFYIGQKKMPAHEAIARAADRVAAMRDKVPATGEQLQINRTQAAVKRNADAANRQPPSTQKAGSGNRSTDPLNMDPLKMSEEDYAKLPEATRKKLRGDIL